MLKIILGVTTVLVVAGLARRWWCRRLENEILRSILARLQRYPEAKEGFRKRTVELGFDPLTSRGLTTLARLAPEALARVQRAFNEEVVDRPTIQQLDEWLASRINKGLEPELLETAKMFGVGQLTGKALFDSFTRSPGQARRFRREFETRADRRLRIRKATQLLAGCFVRGLMGQLYRIANRRGIRPVTPETLAELPLAEIAVIEEETGVNRELIVFFDGQLGVA